MGKDDVVSSELKSNNSRNSTPFSPLLSPMLQSPGTAPLFAPCSSPLPTFSSKPSTDFYKPATHRVKPLVKGDQPVNEQSANVGGTHTQRLPSAKVCNVCSYCIWEYIWYKTFTIIQDSCKYLWLVHLLYM